MIQSGFHSTLGDGGTSEEKDGTFISWVTLGDGYGITARAETALLAISALERKLEGFGSILGAAFEAAAVERRRAERREAAGLLVVRNPNGESN